MRLFVAVELPEPLREHIAVAGARRDAWPPASWVRADNLHLTLAFLGEVAADRVGGLEAALHRHAAGATPFPAHTAAVGAFPSQGALRVVWLGVEPTPAFVALARLARAACAAAALPFDEKPFTPHLTLARCKSPWPAANRDRLAELAPRQPLPFDVESIALVASEPGTAGPRYTRRAEARLGAVA